MRAVISDFPAYPEWNPFICQISGELREGARLDVRIRSVEPDGELRWLGRLVVPGIFDGEHSLRIEPVEGTRSRFGQSERFSGILVGLVKGTLRKTDSGFEQMNAAP